MQNFVSLRLAAVQSDRSHVFFGLTQIAGRPVVALYTRDAADADMLVKSAPVATKGPITLTIRMTGGTMGFDYSVGGHVQTLADNIDATLLSTQKAGGFVGTVVGPYHYTPAS